MSPMHHHHQRDEILQHYRNEYEEVRVEEFGVTGGAGGGGGVSPGLHQRAESAASKHYNKTMNQIHSEKNRNLSSSAAGYSPPGENLLPRNHVIGSRARYEIQMLDSTFHKSNRSKDDSGLFSSLFRRSRRPSDKHKEFVDMLQFPKGNK